MSPPAGCMPVGLWRSVEADLRDREYLDLCGSAAIVIGAEGHGEIACGAMQATPVVASVPTSIGFTWVGFDHEVCGEGTVELLEDGFVEIESSTTTETRPSSRQNKSLLQQPDREGPE
jgi:hypothetical protein